MEKGDRFRNTLRLGLALMWIASAAMLPACGQEGGQPSDLSKKAPPSLGAIANVDGSDEGKKEGQKPAAEAEQPPAQGQAAPAAPKQ
jgi:hypothetical protein